MQSLGISTILIRARRLGADIILSGCAFVTVAALLRMTDIRDPNFFSTIAAPLAGYMLISAIALAILRTYRMIWRYVGFRDLLVLVQAALLAVATYVIAELIVLRLGNFHSGAGVLFIAVVLWAAHIGFLAAPRFIERAASEFWVFGPRARSPDRGPVTQVLITGDDERMEAFIRQCERDPNSRYRVVGVLSDAPQLHGSSLHGIAILGGIDDLAAITSQLADRGVFPKTLILAQDHTPREDLEHLLEQATLANLKMARLPQQGPAQENKSLRSIDLADLLGRPEIQIDSAAGVEGMVLNRRVLVTGAGGSIGSELTRQLASLKPNHLVVTDACEFNLYSIAQELGEKFPKLRYTAILLDVRDGGMVSYWIEKTNPHLVFHAAALKHVPLLEDNPIEGVKTNVFGTANVADACVKFGIEAMVTISTDKAVNPSNVMGATKRLAEAYCQGLDQFDAGGTRKTRFVTVRFGNVLGSAGSVVPLFQRQIEAGGPVTLTHPDINRFFMTISEAVVLVLQAGAHGIERDDDRGSIYVLDMGQPMKIIDLARQMIRLAGYRPDIDIEIKFVGLRPGEKLYEEVMHNDESIIATENKLVLKIAPRTTDLRIIRQQIHELQQACAQRETNRVIRLLQISVPEYVSETRQAI